MIGVKFGKKSENPLNLEEICCENPKIIEASGGNYVCQNCAAVSDKIMDESEKKMYTPYEIKSRKQNDVAWRNFGYRTLFNSNEVVLPDKKKNYYRLDKIQRSLVGNSERNYSVALPSFNIFCSLLEIPSHAKIDAWNIYDAAFKKGLTQGRAINHILAASIVSSLKINELPFFIDNFADKINISTKIIFRHYYLLVRKVFPELGLKIKPQKYPINQIISGLNLNKYEYDLNYCSKLMDYLPDSGKSPSGLLSAIFYIYSLKKSKSDKGAKKTQQEISKEFCVTGVTVRARAKDIKNYISKPNSLLHNKYKKEQITKESIEELKKILSFLK